MNNLYPEAASWVNPSTHSPTYFQGLEVKSNTLTLEWPPKSGQMLEVPEADRADWFEISAASRKVHPGQPGLLQRLAEILKVPYSDQSSGTTEEKLNDTQASLL